MKKILSVVALMLIMSFTARGQSSNWAWAKVLSDTVSNAGYSIAVDVKGNVYTTGNFMGTTDFDPGIGLFYLTATGNTDIFISKLDSAGNFVWAKQMSGTNDGASLSIVVDDTCNAYLAGNFTGTVDFDPGVNTFYLTAGLNDISISKLDSSGNFVWAKQIGGPSNQGSTILSLDDGGNIFIAGGYEGTTDFDPSPSIFNLTSSGLGDGYICKLDNQGNFIWAKSIGGTESDGIFSLGLDSSGNIYATGNYEGIADFDPNIGVNNLTSAGGINIFILKLNNAGSLDWAKSIGGFNNILVHSLAVDAAGNSHVSGSFLGTVDFDPGGGTYNLTVGSQSSYSLKLDNLGNFIWAKKIADDSDCLASTLDAFGYLYSAGFFEGTVDFDPGLGTFYLTASNFYDMFISKINSNGNFISAIAVPGIGYESIWSIAVDNSENVYITGLFDGSPLNFGAIAINNSANNGHANTFIAKLTSSLTSMEDLTEVYSLEIFPNPTKLETTISSFERIKNLELFTVTGIVALSNKNVNDYKATVDLKDLPEGIYFISVETERGITVKKLVKV